MFAVGGGLATLPFLFQMAEKYEWLDLTMAGNFIAIAQSAPGAIGVNIAVQTGFASGSGAASSVAGGCLAALGLITPAIAVISLTAKVLNSAKDNKIAVSVFYGLRPAAAGLLAAAGMGALKLALVNMDAAIWHEMLRIKESILFAAFFLLIYKLKGHPVIYIAAGAAAGILLGL